MRVLASRRFPGPAWETLADVEVADWPPVAPRPGVEVAALVMAHVGDRELDLLPDVRLVANYGVGYDGIDVDACARRGVAVSNTPDALGRATADLALALILAARRRVVEGDRFVRDGRWGTDWVEGALMGDDVAGATLGVVGVGRIGAAVISRARAFDMRVLYTRRSGERLDGLEFRELDDLFSEADIVSLHLPLTDDTHGLVDARRLTLLRDGALLVNTARGAIVDEVALVRELESGRIRAALDVFVDEPRVPSVLLGLPNVIVLPHVGSATSATREAATAELVANIRAALDGREPPNLVPGSATLT
ncbi:MAG TPA: NAD(P)-dependent oxidoreductase [Gaiellaceae bacterium]|nr:NAD(P)-dependent oxidoreductase [Gaiellaceae bacterium]